MRALAVACALAGCASFEDPTIVIDLRVLAIEVDRPEQLLDVDPMMPPTLDELLAQLRPITVRALIAEPQRRGNLGWSMTACMIEDDGRCAPGGASIYLGGGELPDPEHNGFGSPCEFDGFEEAGVVCARLHPDAAFAALLYEAFQADPARGLGGIDVGIVLRVHGMGEGPIAEAYASKRVRIAPRFPLERTENTNPRIEMLLLGRDGTSVDIFRRHCAGSTSFQPDVRAGQRVTLFPVAREGDREEYVVPTLDGQFERFTEYLSYQWVAMSGTFTDANTGGPPDAFGNVKLDGTDWEAPAVLEPTDVSIWVVQRDPRYGLYWREACLRVVP